MNFLNKEKKEARWLTVILGILLAASYVFANFSEADMTVKAMGIMMGTEMSGGYYALLIIGTTVFSYLFFILFVSMAYSIAYRTLVNKTRDVKVMPISKDAFINHLQFVMIFANLIIGAVSFALRQFALAAPLVDMLVRFLVKGLAYFITMLLLARVGVGENVKKKLAGGFLTPLAVLTVLLI